MKVRYETGTFELEHIEATDEIALVIESDEATTKLRVRIVMGAAEGIALNHGLAKILAVIVGGRGAGRGRT